MMQGKQGGSAVDAIKRAKQAFVEERDRLGYKPMGIDQVIALDKRMREDFESHLVHVGKDTCSYGGCKGVMCAVTVFEHKGWNIRLCSDHYVEALNLWPELRRGIKMELCCETMKLITPTRYT